MLALLRPRVAVAARCAVPRLAVLPRAVLPRLRRHYSQSPPLPASTAASLQAAEATANRNLDSAAHQAAFYKQVLAARFPHIVVSRYETPGIARDAECTRLYQEAVAAVGKTPSGSQGSPQLPLHVVITELPWTVFFNWAKFAATVLFLFYFASKAINTLLDLGLLRGLDISDKAIDVSTSNVRFDDVCGVDEARAELEEIVEFLKDPSKFTGLGGKLPKGILLTGPPGTGKTLLARATAGEAGVPFFFMSGSEFDELYVGVGAKRVRELFAQARERGPAIIFIDELDAVGGKRNPKDQAYAKQTLNQLLVELDGFSQTEGIIIIGATNFPESLDKALTRPGRFDKEVNVELPDVRGRLAILAHHMKKVEIARDVDTSVLARGTPGLLGAELMNLVNQAAVYAAQCNALAVDMLHFEWAKDKILLGAAKKAMVMTEELRSNTAYHEAGHAIMAMFTPSAMPLYKATILPRGRALGITFQLPEMDKHDLTRAECHARLDVCMGGKLAEELTRGPDNTTSGCLSDLGAATSTARAMVTQYGMSDKIGPVRMADDWSLWSPKLRDMADEEVRRMLVESEQRTRDLLTARKVELERLAQGLLEYETLTRDEMEKVVRGEKLPRGAVQTNRVIKVKLATLGEGIGEGINTK